MILLDICRTCRLHMRCKGFLHNNCLRYKSKQREIADTFIRMIQIDAARKCYDPKTHARIRGEQ